jgi:hypothetical protein
MIFSIRDLFLVTVIVATLVAWWVDHRQKVADARKLEEGWNATKKELTQAEQRAVHDRKIVSALGRAGFADVHRPDGTVTVERASDVDGRGFNVPTSSAPAPHPPKP